MGVAAIFGPQTKGSAGHVQSMCDAMEIPHISTIMELDQDRLKGINMHPHVRTYAMVYYKIYF